MPDVSPNMEGYEYYKSITQQYIVDYAVDNLGNLIGELGYFKQKIAKEARIKHTARHENDTAEFDRACRALNFYRQLYKSVCNDIHARLPYR